jgi:zinc transport system ATP-binding protein
MMSEPLLSVSDLTVSVNGTAIVDSVSLRVDPGEVVAVVGPNGAGKSTLLRAILGLIPFSGEVRRTDRVGYVPQTLDFDRNLPLTVEEFLALSRQNCPVWCGASTLNDGGLERLGIGELQRRPLGRLSGGELRKVLVARALQSDPELLVLDEPGAGVDPAAVEVISERIREFQTTPVGVLMVSHNLPQIRSVAQRVIGLAHSVRFSGPPAEFLTGESLFELYH